MTKNRMKAIKIMEFIDEQLGERGIFDNAWFMFEEGILEIISRKGEKTK
jgi:hypothetical protein